MNANITKISFYNLSLLLIENMILIYNYNKMKILEITFIIKVMSTK